MPIEEDKIAATASLLATTLRDDRPRFDVIREYVRGNYGLPRLKSSASPELFHLRSKSRRDILRPVIETYTSALEVQGYNGSDSEPVEEAWAEWNRLDLSTQQEAVHRACVTYGVGYLFLSPGEDGLEVRAGSPRQTAAIFRQTSDRLPLYALEVWSDAFNVKHGLLYDDTYVYPLIFGDQFSTSLQGIGTPVAHGMTLAGKPVTPCVRFLNVISADDEDTVMGDVEPLFSDQEGLNEVSFRRLIAAKYGASPQKVISNLDVDSPDGEIDISAMTDDEILAFAGDVKATQFTPSNLAYYTDMIKGMTADVAINAGLNPVTMGATDMSNMSAESIEQVNRTHKSRVEAKQKALRGSWKTVLRMIGSYVGLPDDPGSEVLWKIATTLSIGSTGDFISKASASGMPVKHFVDLIPELTPQVRRSIKADIDELGAIDGELALAQALSDISTGPGEQV